MASKGLDAYLIQVAEGNMAAFQQLYDEMKKPVFALAFSIVHNQHAAEDIVQETFIKVFQHAALYHRGTKPTAWIYKLTQNCCMDYLKRANRDIVLETVAVLDSSLTDSFSDIAEREIITQAMKQLDETERTIVTLYLVVGMKQTEIAEWVNLPYRIVRSKYRYAIKKLQHYLSDKG